MNFIDVDFNTIRSDYSLKPLEDTWLVDGDEMVKVIRFNVDWETQRSSSACPKCGNTYAIRRDLHDCNISDID